MKVQSQRSAVFAAFMAVMSKHGVEFIAGETIADEVTSPEMRKEIYAILCEGFRKGEIEFKDTPANQEKLSTPSKLNTYVSGLVSNWFRKDQELNGGVKYEAKNPGSRAGSGDPQLKALRLLATKFKGTPKHAEITKHIEARVATIQAEKAKSVTVDLSILDPSLVASLGLNEE